MERGLTESQAHEILEKHGRNEIKRTKKINPVKIFLEQFSSPLVQMLILAVIFSFGSSYLPGAESNFLDGFLILVIVIFIAFSGFFQEYKAEKTIEALKKMSTPKAKVIRDGKEMVIEASLVVPGDLILLEAGDIVPADANLLECNKLKTDESILTGESVDVKKENDCKVFMNTYVTMGNGKAIVSETGMDTRVGKIAKELQEIHEEKSSFQRELDRLSKKIFWMIVVLIIIIASVSFFKYDIYTAVLTSISIAVAAIPEGLPAVVTLSLALGAKSMSKKSALLRKLSTVESIGAVNIICTDKTGTLTMDEMTVRKVMFNGNIIEPEKMEKANLLLHCGVMCNNSSIGYGQDGEKEYIGDQTEVALTKLGEKFGLLREEMERETRRVDEIPFSSKRKMMTVRLDDGIVFSKGAPEILIEKCDRIYENGEAVELDKEKRNKILEENKNFASEGLRVLGFAYKKSKDSKNMEEGLIWLGLQAMSDPPRPEVNKALEDCRTAGIRVIMITGDNAVTAEAIAREIGLESKGSIEGNALDKMSNEEVKRELESGLNIFARTSPEHKLRLIEILEEDNEIAMTGDGVNDSLALKKAGVGISMGKKGTEVAKEASDMILLDDNFATIRNSVREGRRIFENIRKFVNYLFACNIAEVLVLFLATLFISLEEPILLPVQLLWINLMTDGMPALALGVDPPIPGTMKKKPRKKGEPIIDKKLMRIIVAMGVQITVMLFAVFFLTLPLGVDVARTAIFTGFILYEFVRIGVIRYQEKLSWFSNKWLLFALVVSLLMQLVIVYTPLNTAFGIVPLGVYPWTVLILGAFFGGVLGIVTTHIIINFSKE